MKRFAFDRELGMDRPQGTLEVVVTDSAGMAWSHSNPAELYRWIALRNNLLNTIAVAFTKSQNPPSFPRPMIG